MKLFFKRSFVRDVITVASGAASMHVITIACAPIVTRLYGPEVIGILGAFTSFFIVISPMAALSYPMAQVLPKDDHKAFEIVRLSVSLTIILASFIGLFIFIGGNWLVDFIDIPVITDYLYFIPFCVLFSGWVDISQQWIIRKRLFLITAKMSAVQSLVVNSAKIIVGLHYPTAWSLVAITTIGYLLHAIMLGVASFSSIKQNFNIKKTNLLLLANEYKDFPLYRTPQIVINAMSQSLPVLMLVTLFSSSAAGYYVVGRMVMGLPATLIAKSVGDALYPKITEASNQGKDIVPFIKKATIGLAIAGLIPCFFMVFLGPWFFDFVFGPGWSVAGEYARWLTFFYFFNFINKPCVAAVPVLRIQKGLLFYELFSTAIKVMALLLGYYYFHNDIVAVALFSIAGAMMYIAMMIWIINEANKLGSKCEKTSQ